MKEREDRVIFNLSTYKLIFIADLLDTIDELKKSSREVKSKLAVEGISRKKKRFVKYRGAYFELLVNKYVDIENLIDSLAEPLRTVIKERLFLKDPEEVRRRLGVATRKEAERIVRKSVNKFFDMVERYLKS